MAKQPKPQDLYEQADELFDEAQGRNSLYDAMDALYDAQPPKPSDDPFVQILKMPYPTSTVDLVVDLASNQALTLAVPAASESKKAIEQADAQEGWLRALLSLNERFTHRNLNAEAAYLGAQRALVVMRTLFRESAIREAEQDGSYSLSGLPVLLQVRDPYNIVFDESMGELVIVAERFRRKARSIRRNYPGALKDEEQYPDESEVDWTEVWTRQHCAYFAGGEPIKVAGKDVRAHRYGCIPYAFGMARTIPRPENRFRPLLASVEALSHNIDIAFSVLATAGWQTVVGGVNVFSDSYGRENNKRIDNSPGSVNYFANGDRVEPWQRAPMPADFFQMLNLFLTAYQAGTFPFAMYGQVPGGMAGYAINMLTQSGRRAIAPIWGAIERAYEGAFYNAVTICRELVAPTLGVDEIPLSIVTSAREGGVERKVKRSLKLAVKDIGDDWDIQVALADPMPQDEASNLRMALEATKGGVLSQQTALTKYKVVEDALAEMERMAVEGVFKQLAPLEAVKLAISRGYVPQNVQLPTGWKMNEDGTIQPDLTGQATPPPAANPPAPLPQENMGGIMSNPGAQQEAAEAQVDPAMMQALMGQQAAMPTMEALSGAPPPPPQVMAQ